MQIEFDVDVIDKPILTCGGFLREPVAAVFDDGRKLVFPSMNTAKRLGKKSYDSDDGPQWINVSNREYRMQTNVPSIDVEIMLKSL